MASDHQDDVSLTDLADIEAEHNYFYDLLRRFECMASSPIASRQLQAFIRSLVVHTEQHWSHEESVMKSCGYPHYAAHVRSHQDGLKSIDELLASRKSESETIDVLKFFLSTWLTDHIQSHDADFGAWLKGKAGGMRASQ